MLCYTCTYRACLVKFLLHEFHYQSVTWSTIFDLVSLSSIPFNYTSHYVFQNCETPSKPSGWLSRYRDWLRAGRSGDRIPVERDFPRVQTGPGAHLVSCTMGTGSFPGIKCGRGVLLTTHPLLVPRSWKSRAIPLPTLWATTGPVMRTLYLFFLHAKPCNAQHARHLCHLDLLFINLLFNNPLSCLWARNGVNYSELWKKS